MITEAKGDMIGDQGPRDIGLGTRLGALPESTSTGRVPAPAPATKCQEGWTTHRLPFAHSTERIFAVERPRRVGRNEPPSASRIACATWLFYHEHVTAGTADHALCYRAEAQVTHTGAPMG